MLLILLTRSAVNEKVATDVPVEPARTGGCRQDCPPYVFFGLVLSVAFLASAADSTDPPKPAGRNAVGRCSPCRQIRDEAGLDG